MQAVADGKYSAFVVTKALFLDSVHRIRVKELTESGVQLFDLVSVVEQGVQFTKVCLLLCLLLL